MNCPVCGGRVKTVTEKKTGRYRDETVEVVSELMRCKQCGEGFLTPEQMAARVRDVKNEIRKKYGLLPPKKVKNIREKLCLTQAELEDLLGTGPKVVVRWESGKVIQSSGHDNLLRLLDREPKILELLRQVQKSRLNEQQRYNSAKPVPVAV